MYYGELDGFGMEDLAASEMGQLGQAQTQQQPVFQSSDLTSIGQSAGQAANLAAQYMLARNPQWASQIKLPPIPGQQQTPPPASGMSPGLKVALGIGIAAAGIGALVWIMGKKKRSANRSKPEGKWRTIGD